MTRLSLRGHIAGIGNEIPGLNWLKFSIGIPMIIFHICRNFINDIPGHKKKVLSYPIDGCCAHLRLGLHIFFNHTNIEVNIGILLALDKGPQRFPTHPDGTGRIYILRFVDIQPPQIDYFGATVLDALKSS